MFDAVTKNIVSFFALSAAIVICAVVAHDHFVYEHERWVVQTVQTFRTTCISENVPFDKIEEFQDHGYVKKTDGFDPVAQFKTAIRAWRAEYPDREFTEIGLRDAQEVGDIAARCTYTIAKSVLNKNIGDIDEAFMTLLSPQHADESLQAIRKRLADLDQRIESGELAYRGLGHTRESYRVWRRLILSSIFDVYNRQLKSQSPNNRSDKYFDFPPRYYYDGAMSTAASYMQESELADAQTAITASHALATDQYATRMIEWLRTRPPKHLCEYIVEKVAMQVTAANKNLSDYGVTKKTLEECVARCPLKSPLYY